MYVMYARNARMADVGMRMGDEEGIPNKTQRERHAYVFPFAAVLLNSFAFSIAA